MLVANTTSQDVQVFPKHTNLGSGKGRVHGNVVFRDLDIWQVWPAIDGPVGGMFAFVSFCHTHPCLYGLVCGRSSQIFTSSLVDSRFLLCHWSCGLVWCMWTARTHLFQDMLSRPEGASVRHYATTSEWRKHVLELLITSVRIAVLSSAQRCRQEVGGYCTTCMVCFWSRWRFAGTLESGPGL